MRITGLGGRRIPSQMVASAVDPTNLRASAPRPRATGMLRPCPVGPANRVIGSAREQTQERTLALEEPAQRLRDRENQVAVRDGGGNLLQELLGEPDGTLRLTARADVARLAGEGEQVLSPAARTTDAGEAVDEPPAIQERRDRPGNDGAQRTTPGLGHPRVPDGRLGDGSPALERR